MICSEYIRTQPIPACWNATQELTGMSVPVNATAVKVYFKNLATGLVNILDVTTGGAGEVDIDMDDVAPLYPHTYEITVLSVPDRVTYEITINAETGCAVRFKSYDNTDDPANSIELTTASCLIS